MDPATLGLIAAATLCASAALVLAFALVGGTLDWLHRDALHRRMARDLAARKRRTIPKGPLP